MALAERRPGAGPSQLKALPITSSPRNRGSPSPTHILSKVSRALENLRSPLRHENPFSWQENKVHDWAPATRVHRDSPTGSPTVRDRPVEPGCPASPPRRALGRRNSPLAFSDRTLSEGMDAQTLTTPSCSPDKTVFMTHVKEAVQQTRQLRPHFFEGVEAEEPSPGAPKHDPPPLTATRVRRAAPTRCAVSSPASSPTHSPTLARTVITLSAHSQPALAARAKTSGTPLFGPESPTQPQPSMTPLNSPVNPMGPPQFERPLLDQLGHNQGSVQVCWSFAIGNAIARATQLRYGVLLNPEIIADRLTGEFRHFDQHSVYKVLVYLQDSWADPQQPWTLLSMKEREGRLVGSNPVCLHITEVQYVGPNNPKPVEGRPGWYVHFPKNYEALVATLEEDPGIAAVISLWTEVEGDFRSSGHAVAFQEVQDGNLICKNSHSSPPVLTVSKHNFKGAVTFRAHVSHLIQGGGVTSRYGCHGVTERGISLPHIDGGPASDPTPSAAST